MIDCLHHGAWIVGTDDDVGGPNSDCEWKWVCPWCGAEGAACGSYVVAVAMLESERAVSH